MDHSPNQSDEKLKPIITWLHTLGFSFLRLVVWITLVLQQLIQSALWVF